jgi:hypothetical protein
VVDASLFDKPGGAETMEQDQSMKQIQLFDFAYEITAD